MNPTERTLQSTKRTPTIREEYEEHASRRISGVSRSVSDQLDANERHMTQMRTAPVDFPRMIHDAVRQTALHREGKLLLQLPDGVFVQGPADDLREMIASLAEYVSSGSDKVEFRAQVNYTDDQTRPSCTAELVTRSLDVPDYLRSKMWQAVGKRRGQVSIKSESTGCRIGFTLPVERRLGTVLG